MKEAPQAEEALPASSRAALRAEATAERSGPRGLAFLSAPLAGVSGDPRRARRARAVLGRVALLVAGLGYASPLVYFVLGSLKRDEDVIDGLRGFAPTGLSFDNYVQLVTHTLNSESTGYLWRFFLTSFTVTGVVVVGGLVVNSMAAYAFARLEWKGRDAALAAVIALTILPFEAIAIPLYYMLHGNEHKILIQALPFVANAFSIYLFYSFFIGLPKAIDEAARIDGAGSWRIFVQIIVPMSRPVYATVAITTFLTAWAQYLWPLLVVPPDQNDAQPLPTALGYFAGSNPTALLGQRLAFGVLMVTPVVIVYLIFQRWFIASMATSGLKG
jgi:multiple sugar transport system permease protein